MQNMDKNLPSETSSFQGEGHKLSDSPKIAPEVVPEVTELTVDSTQTPFLGHTEKSLFSKSTKGNIF